MTSYLFRTALTSLRTDLADPYRGPKNPDAQLRLSYFPPNYGLDYMSWSGCASHHIYPPPRSHCISAKTVSTQSVSTPT